MKIILKKNYLFIIFYLTILIGFYFDEDLLGGAKHDYLFHIRFIELFSKDFIEGIKIYGYEDYLVRNSPIFYIILSQLNKLVGLETIRIFNSISSLLLVLIFYRCLKIKFQNINNEILKILSCIIFLSPMVRSHAIWPYPIMWGLIFFTLSIFYFLKFKNVKTQENKYFYISIIFLVISSYVHITFSVFGIYYLIYFLKNNKLNFSFIKFIIFIFIISLPAIWFIFFREDIYLFKGPEGFERTYYDIFNIFNKIAIISTIMFFYLIPFFDNKLILKDIKRFNFIEIFLVILIFTLCVFFFNYPYTNSFGGGYFFKLSSLIFKNNILFYLIFFISLLIFIKLFDYNFNNFLLLFILLICYNLQFTIYIKYYDPLLFILYFSLFEFKIVESFLKKSNFLYRIYFFCFTIYFIFLIKDNINDIFSLIVY